MSTAYINRSLTTVRTELEFLADLEVITPELLQKLLQSIPQKYAKDQGPWGVDHLTNTPSNASVAPSNTTADSVADDLRSTHISAQSTASSRPPAAKPLGFAKAIYDYSSQEKDDLALSKGDKLVIVEHLSSDWWKGYKKGQSASSAGVFPSNYVLLIQDSEFESLDSNNTKGEKVEYRPPQDNYGPPPPQYGQQQHQQYSGPPQGQSYANFPPPSTNYYQQPPQQQQQQQQQQPEQLHQLHHGGAFKKFGGKLGNAAIFGAGATIGSDIVNSIF